MKIVKNVCFGSFSLSHEAVLEVAKLKGLKLHYKKTQFLDCYSYWIGSSESKESYFYPHDLERTDPALVAVVESLDKKSWGRFAKLEVVDIPDGTEYEIEDHDGQESIHELH